MFVGDPVMTLLVYDEQLQCACAWLAISSLVFSSRRSV